MQACNLHESPNLPLASKNVGANIQNDIIQANTGIIIDEYLKHLELLIVLR